MKVGAATAAVLAVKATAAANRPKRLLMRMGCNSFFIGQTPQGAKPFRPDGRRASQYPSRSCASGPAGPAQARLADLGEPLAVLRRQRISGNPLITGRASARIRLF